MRKKYVALLGFILISLVSAGVYHTTYFDGGDYYFNNSIVTGENITTGDGLILGGVYIDTWDDVNGTDGGGSVTDVWVNESGDTMTGKLTIEDDLNVTGNIYLGGDILGANADVAQQFNVFQVVEPGDVVVAYKKVMLQISAQPYDNRVVGVVSTNPFMTLGISRKGTPIVMAGTAPTKVCDEGGEIKAGDLLTTSSRKGYAMKLELLDVTKARTFSELKQMIRENDIRRMSAFGKALEDFDDNSGKITAIINLM